MNTNKLNVQTVFINFQDGGQAFNLMFENSEITTSLITTLQFDIHVKFPGRKSPDEILRTESLG